MLSARGSDAPIVPEVEPDAYTPRLFPPDLELPLRVRSDLQSPYQIFRKIEQLFSKCQVIEVLVLFDFVNIFRDYLHEHKTHQSFRWNLADCEVCLYLVDPVLDCNVCLCSYRSTSDFMLPRNQPLAALSDSVSMRKRLLRLASIALSRIIFFGSGSGSKSGGFLTRSCLN